jgi:hypothetical protein
MSYWVRSALITLTAAGTLVGSEPALAAGNACKADLNGDLVVNFADLAILKSVFFQKCSEPPPTGGTFPATGQTTCWNAAGVAISCAGTGQDGAIQAGATLTYSDNGNGTINDANTGLVWEKLSDDGTIHDRDNTYTWANAFSVKIAALNAGAGFAGHKDWRVPNKKELESIINAQVHSPAVSAVFHTGCAPAATVLTGSCTRPSYYWASSSYVYDPTRAWRVGFDFGAVGAGFKADALYVRAVRGGS